MANNTEFYHVVGMFIACFNIFSPQSGTEITSLLTVF